MNKSLLMLFTCLLWTADGQQDLRKEGRDPASLPQQLDISNGKRENSTLEREKRMPDAEKMNDGSFGYAWNVGSGVSYMKIHVGKSSKQEGTDSFAAAQHEVTSSLRDKARNIPQNHDKRSYEKIHKDFLKMSQKIASQKNLNTKPTLENQKALGVGKQEFNFKDFAKYAFNKEHNKEMKGAQASLEFNHQLKQEYDKFNKDVQLLGRPTVSWPQHQAQIKESNYAHILNENLKSLQSSAKDDFEDGTAQRSPDDKPIQGFEYQQVLKNLKNQQNYGIGENFDGVYKSIDVPLSKYSFGAKNQGYSHIQGFHSDENSEIKNPPSDQIEQNNGPDVGDAVFKYIGETNLKPETDEEQEIPVAFNKQNQGEAWSTQNVVSKHQSKEEDTEENQANLEEQGKDEEIQKVVQGFSYPYPDVGNLGSQFQAHHENVHPQIANDFNTAFFNGMHPAMNQKLVDEQVERIKQMQQKIVESHFPGSSVYAVLGGNQQHEFSTQGHPVYSQEDAQSAGYWKQDMANGLNNPKLAYTVQNNHGIMNSNHHKEAPFMPMVNTGAGSSSNVRLAHSARYSKRHGPFLNNNPRVKYMQNQFPGGHKFVNYENNSEKEASRTKDETVWRPQRYSIKSKKEHGSDFQKEAYEESENFKKEDSLKENDERKGREIKHGFEEESAHLDHKEIHSIDHTKGHVYEDKEEKTILAGNFNPQYKYPVQEPQVKVITKAVPVHKELKIPVPQMVRHPILIPFPVKVLEPYPIKIPVPVTVEKTVEVPVEKVIHYPVEKPVPRKVIKEVRVPVPKPYPVKVPVYKIKYVHHNKKKHE